MGALRRTTVFLLIFWVGLSCLPEAARAAGAGSDTQHAAKSVNVFAMALCPRLGEANKNLFFSPFSISAALTMTYAGARGNTAAQMAETLHFDTDGAGSVEAFGKLSAALKGSGRDKGSRLAIANALWAQQGYQFLPDYLQLVSDNLQGKLAELDFRKDPEAARGTINRWVEGETKSKIKDLLPTGVLDAYTRLVLTNAVYFKGTWANAFDAKRTKPDQFTLMNGSRVQVPMMQRHIHCEYLQSDGIQVLALPYEGGDLSMVVLLPSDPAGLAQLEKSLNLDRLEAWSAKLQKRDVSVLLPKFSITTPSYRMRPVLEILGMPDAFGQKADFSGMSGKQDLFLQEVFHKAFVDVNEKGTEAAAATGAVVALRSSPAPLPEFRADHPFLFLIRHNPTGCILFMGRLVKP
jgi:serpin B